MQKFYFDPDADLSKLHGRKVAIIGYGNQGRSQALNLRDSGVDVVVGNIEDEFAEIARQDGWTVLPIAEAAAQADIKMMLTSDDSQPDVFTKWVEPTLKPGDVMSFAHGFNIHYGEIKPPADVDVVMVAPRMLGEGVRATFLEGRGFPSLIAVHQDATGSALDMTLALSKGIGSTKMGVLMSSFEEETLIDLFEEHQPGLYGLRAMFEALVEAGCSPEAVMLDLYASGEGVKWAEYGRDLGAFERMKRASQTAQFGHLVWSKQYFDREAALAGMREMIANIKNGSFYRALKEQKQANLKQLEEVMAENDEHEMIKREHELYKLLGRRPKDA
ncbi:ketol-acid reductoisomerase [Rhodoligotrophos defluvii]|uniref:ketol-acid reductoisomerase n=1 Tax=Rhodoligotrophos defluvii TaxID=2561934 RepID=UPI0010C9D8BE|nr:ketol-acid reductoisomerase [Rhodoligotrophos defluvii]